MNLAHFVATQGRAIVVMIVMLCIAGVYAAIQLPVAILPSTDFPRIVIIVDDGVVPAAQMLPAITRRIEEAMNGLPGIQRIRSTTARGSCEVNLFFAWGSDIVQSLQLVQARLSQLTASLPKTAAIRRVERLTFAVFPVAGYSLTATKTDPTTLRDLAEYVVRPRLARLAGVAGVAVAGGQVREVHVRLDPARLAARAVSAAQVADAVRNSNTLDSPGLIDENHQLELALVDGRARTPAQLGKIAVPMPSGPPIRVGDVAEIREGHAPNYTLVTAAGKPAVLLSILRQPSASTVDVVDAIDRELTAIKQALPADVTITPFYDQSLLVRSSMVSVRDAIAIGLGLSVVILYAFLGSWGSTIVAVVVIPVAILVSCVVMWVLGLSFNVMTLGGIAASIGLVIDDAIVVVENIFTHLRRGENHDTAIRKAIAEITVPIIGSTITPVAVLVPLSFLTGVTGSFGRSLSLTMASALLTSLVLALTLTPVLSRWLIKVPAGAAGGAEHDEEDDAGWLLSRIRGGYERVLGFGLRHPFLVALACLGVIYGTYRLSQKLGTEFLPAFDEGAFVLDYTSPPGASLGETDRMLGHVEEILKQVPEVESYSRRTGLQLGLSITEPNTGDFLVKLKNERKRSTDQVTEDVRGQVASAEPSLRIEFAGILGDLIGDLTSSPAPIEVKLFSDNVDQLHAKAAEIADAMKSIPGVVDQFSGVVVSGPAVQLVVDPARAAAFGVNASDVARTLDIAMTGDTASSMLVNGRLIDVRVLMPDAVRTSLAAVKTLPMRSPTTNALFRVDQVADVVYESGQTEVRRDGLRRSVAITGRLENVDLGTAVAAVQKLIATKIVLPPGMTYEMGGLFEEQQSSFREMTRALVTAIGLVFFVLLLEFRSFPHPLAIVGGASLSLSGVLLALKVSGITLNIVSLMGMIMVLGIVAKNGILMLDTVSDHLAAGEPLRDALLRSGRRRFRPVLMTSLAAMLGMLPLAFAVGAGAQMLQPLAVGVIGGLMMALVLSLIVTPVLFAALWREEPRP